MSNCVEFVSGRHGGKLLSPEDFLSSTPEFPLDGTVAGVRLTLPFSLFLKVDCENVLCWFDRDLELSVTDSLPNKNTPFKCASGVPFVLHKSPAVQVKSDSDAGDECVFVVGGK